MKYILLGLILLGLSSCGTTFSTAKVVTHDPTTGNVADRIVIRSVMYSALGTKAVSESGHVTVTVNGKRLNVGQQGQGIESGDSAAFGKWFGPLLKALIVSGM